MTITIEIEGGCVTAVFTDSLKRVNVCIIDRDAEKCGEESETHLMAERQEKGKCLHCDRAIVKQHGAWMDPEATSDDSVWRFTCDRHDTMQAEHEPK